jgi:hypothetical protein
MKRGMYSVLMVIAWLLVGTGPMVTDGSTDDNFTINVSPESTTHMNGKGVHALAAPTSGDHLRPPSENQLRLAQPQGCLRRVGPFTTQDTAWQRWAEVRGQGYAVTRDVILCYDEVGTRGYCFHAFVWC